MSNTFYAVMHCTPLQPKKLNTLLNKVIANLTANVATFATPDPTIATLQAEVTPFANAIAIAAANNGSPEDTAARNNEAVKVHNLLKAGLSYINKIAAGDKDTVLLSGYDASNEATPAAVPPVPVIKSIKEGATHGSAKIMLAKTTSVLLGVKIKRTLIVEMTTTGTDPNSFKIVLITGSSKKLIISGLAKGVEIFVRISAINAKGQSQYSATVSYIPQTGASASPTSGPVVPVSPATA